MQSKIKAPRCKWDKSNYILLRIDFPLINYMLIGPSNLPLPQVALLETLVGMVEESQGQERPLAQNNRDGLYENRSSRKTDSF